MYDFLNILFYCVIVFSFILIVRLYTPSRKSKEGGVFYKWNKKDKCYDTTFYEKYKRSYD